uniref:EG45-like domain containing protein 1 n=1 Tax=Nicotiana tabacum TaxID=4097 RepID=A0A1S3Y7Z9_TOBAC|nr:PREDICTED: putative EG45-like domain containing protein 1 [Nicotiana tabacum]
MPLSKCILVIICVVATLFSIALAIPGTAKYWSTFPSQPTDCFGNTPQGTLLAASDHLGGEYNCGTLVKVTCTGTVPHPCTGKSVVVKVVDDCPGCDATMLLDKAAYSIIANPVTTLNAIKVDYVN